MQIPENEYQREEERFLKEQFALADPEPVGMFGTWAWHVKTKRKFAEMNGAKMSQTSARD